MAENRSETATVNDRRAPEAIRLDRERVVEAALEIVRQDGLEALSMRRIAAHLGSGAMSLYRHVRDRDDLLLGMLDHVAKSIPAPPPGRDDRDEIASVFEAIHKAMRQDPWIVRVLLFEGLGSLLMLPLIERVFAALFRLGCDRQRAVEIYCLLLHYAYGECLSFQTVAQRARARSAFMAAVEGDYPATAKAFTVVDDWRYDEFDRNVRRILDAL